MQNRIHPRYSGIKSSFFRSLALDDPNKIIWVVGAMGSGNRVLRDVIEQSGVRVEVDTSHGTRRLPLYGQVIVIERLRDFTHASRERNWAGKPEYIKWENSVRGIKMRYPHALRVRYRELCDNTDEVIRMIADYIGIEPWENKIELVNMNHDPQSD